MTMKLSEQFRGALTRVGIEPKGAMAAHAEGGVHLEADPNLRSWGVDTILIGSYARKVSIYPCQDVDVFVKLPDCPETVGQLHENVHVLAWVDRNFPCIRADQNRVHTP